MEVFMQDFPGSCQGASFVHSFNTQWHTWINKSDLGKQFIAPQKKFMVADP